MTKPTTLSGQPGRPASIVICLAVFALFLAVFIRSILEIGPARINVLFFVHATLTLNAVICLLVYQRSQVTYYITSAALLALVLKTVYVVLKYPSHLTLPADSLINPLPSTGLFFGACLLLWRFTLGRPCRAFYGFRA
jgi:hypothetical protein